MFGLSIDRKEGNIILQVHGKVQRPHLIWTGIKPEHYVQYLPRNTVVHTISLRTTGVEKYPIHNLPCSNCLASWTHGQAGNQTHTSPITILDVYYSTVKDIRALCEEKALFIYEAVNEPKAINEPEVVLYLQYVSSISQVNAVADELETNGIILSTLWQ